MFDSGQSNEITIFKNRIEIYNPGAFPTNKTPDEGFVVVFYRYGTQKLNDIAQKTAQKEEKTTQKGERINALLEYCKEPRDRDEMMKFLGIKHRTIFRSDYLNLLLDEGKLAMTTPDRPRSKNQKFYSI